MSDTKKVEKVEEAEASATVITLVLPVDKTKPATVTVRNGDLGHLSSFAYDDFKDICTALNDGMRAFVQVQANPPQNIQATKAVTKTGETSKKKKASKKQAKAKGKAPYRLQDAWGQTRTLSTMLDPFELQEKYHKANPKLKFDSLDEACEVAQILIDAGIEKTVTITYSNGEAIKVLPEKEKATAETASTDELPIVDDQSDEDEMVGDEVLATEKVATTDDVASVIVDVSNKEVTVDGEASIDEASTTDGVPAVSEEALVDASTAVKPAPVIQALTSAVLAKAEAVPEYNEFSLATDDEDDETGDSSTAVPETAQATLF